MESSVKYCNLGSTCRQSSLACLDTDEVCRVMQRSQGEALADNALNIIVYDN